jgi:hypothetical protein
MGCGVAGAGGIELFAPAGQGLGAAAPGRRVEPDVECAGPGVMSPEMVRASRIRA